MENTLRYAGIRVAPIPPGLHLLTAGELDDPTDPRITRYLPLFRDAPPPDPEDGDWGAWQTPLADDGGNGGEAICFRRDDGFGTRSSALIVLPRHPGFGQRPPWLHADGPPDRTPYRPVTI